MNNPFANRAFRDILASARTNGHPSVLFLDPGKWEERIQQSTCYYTELLVLRKLVAQVATSDFHKQHGRQPSPEELTRLVQKKAQDRGLILAKKGLEDCRKFNFHADEELVVCAIFHAILTGHESLILTRDPDLLEQFYKANYLLDTDYRSLLISRSYRETPENLIARDLPDLPFRQRGTRARKCADTRPSEAFYGVGSAAEPRMGHGVLP